MNISLCLVFLVGVGLSNSLPTDKKSNSDIDVELDELRSLLLERIQEQNTEDEDRPYINEERRDEIEIVEEEKGEEMEPDKKADGGEENKKIAGEEKTRNSFLRRFHSPKNQRKQNGHRQFLREKETDVKTAIDNPKNIDPNDPLENLLEGMAIEVNGISHKVLNLHPEESAKTYGDSHDSHKLIPQQQNKASSIGKERNFDPGYLWEKAVIPYEIYSNVSSSTVAVINDAIKNISDTTCVRWVPQSQAGSYGLGHDNFVRFINEIGCWSYVGNVADFTANPDSIQEISLQEPGCISKSTVIHEMLHAMGGHHEQSRADRDNYVEILYDNLKYGRNNGNFYAQATDDHNPYDAESALQYSLYSFSSNGQRTMKFKDQRLEFLADSAQGLEYYDIKDITDSYKCTDGCKNVPSCQNGGFVNFQCVCVCPDGLTGATCTDTVSSSDCGGVVTIGQGEIKFIQSPNYPSSYPTNLECTWLINGTTNNLVRATVEYMDIAAGAACYHWLEYRYNLLGQTGPKRCGTHRNSGDEFWDSTTDELSNAMMIKFNSKRFSNHPAKTGFRLKLENIGTGCVGNPCMYGKCTSPEGTSSYTCTCGTGVTGPNCQTISAAATVRCTFEYGEKCFLDNVKSDQFDWELESGATPLGNTGPRRAVEGYQYIYIQSWGRGYRSPGDTAVLVNSNVTLERSLRCLSFYYHMYGYSVGTLKVSTKGQTVPKTQVFSISGNQGDKWNKVELDLSAVDNLKIYFEGIRGTGPYGDIALDDILLAPGTCATIAVPSTTTAQPSTTTAQPATTTAQPATTTAQPATTTAQPATTTAQPATTTAQPATTTAQPATTTAQPTTTTSQPVTTTAQSATTTTLPASTTAQPTTITSQPVTTTTLPASTTAHPATTTAQPATTTAQPTTTMAQLATTTALPPTTTAQPATTTAQPTSHPISSTETCTFEIGTSCFMVDSSNDEFDWTVKSGGTPSYGTGPSQAFEGKWYTYIEVSYPISNNAEATLISAASLPAPDYCLVFAYHMEGASNMGDLVISTGVQSPDKEWLRIPGNQGNQWHEKAVEFTGGQDVKLFITANKVQTFQGDIAIDNLRLYTGVCSPPVVQVAQPAYSVISGSSVTLVCTISSDLPITQVFWQRNINGSMTTINITTNTNKYSGSTTNTPSLTIYNADQGDIGTYSCFASNSVGTGQSGTTTLIVIGTTTSQPATTWDTTVVSNRPTSQPLYSTETCTFEKGTSCFMVDSSEDDFDWTVKSGGTPSSGTGPSQAFEGDRYTYIEVSYPISYNAEATLVSSASLPAPDYCLVFAYHMEGAWYMGDLVISTGVQSPDKEWLRIPGNQGNQWHEKTVEFTGGQNVKLFITANKGQTFQGDIAIDNVRLYPDVCRHALGACTGVVCQNGGSCLKNATSTSGYMCICPPGFAGIDCKLIDVSMKTSLFCGFEDKNEDCVFKDSIHADFKWIINKKGTPTSGTGPSQAYEGTYYTYMEASSPRVNRDKAILSTESSQLASLTIYCLEFYYHMMGSPGSLTVSVGERNGSNLPLWTISGDQGNQWKLQQLQISPSFKDLEISIIATRGLTYKGDIAVDSISLKKEACTIVVEYKCNFENGETCIFIDSKADDFDWTRRTGTTSSSRTGPTGAYSGTYYMYTEVSYPVSDGQIAILTSENTKLTGSNYCLSLAYQRLGNPGPLIVRAGERGDGTSNIVWEISGNQGSSWKTISIAIPFYSDPVITIQGGKADTWQGDTAIDDVILKKGPCN